jgi:outer membrane protein
MIARALTVVGTLALATAGQAAAQRNAPVVPNRLSLQEAVEMAVRYNPTYQQTANDYRPAAWGVRNAYASILPSFNSSASLSYSGAGTRQFGVNDFTQPSATIGSGYTLSLNWTLDGNTFLQPGVQKAALTATGASIDAARMDLDNGIVQQYLAVLEGQAQVELQVQQVVRNEENLRLAQARFQVGQSTMLDVRQAEVAKGQSDVALLRARNTVVVEKLRLFQQMGVHAPTELDSVVLSDTFEVTEPHLNLESLLSMADADNPNVLALRAQAASAAANENATKTQWLPSAQFTAAWQGFTQQYTNDAFLVTSAQGQSASAIASCDRNNLLNQSVGLPTEDCSQYALTPGREQEILAANSIFPFQFRQQPFYAQVVFRLPIFDQFNRNLQSSQAAAQTEDAQETLRARELQVRTDVSNLYYGLLAAYQAIQIQETNRVSGAEQLRLARERYRVGSGTFFELQDAQLVAQQAEADYITAVYAYHRGFANLEAAVGQKLR